MDVEVKKRIFAHNRQIEEMLCGVVMKDARLYYEVSELIRPNDFFYPQNQKWWSEIGSFIKQMDMDLSAGQRVDVDPMLLSDFFLRSGEWESKKHIMLIVNLFLKRRHEAYEINVTEYARSVRRYADLRALSAAGTELAGEVYDETQDPEDLIRDTVSNLMKHVETTSKTRKSLESITTNWAENIEGWISGETGGASGTGIPAIDDLLGGGIVPGRSYYIGGLTKMGKTTLALAIGRHLALRQGWAVDIVSVEMQHEDLMRCLVQAESGINLEAWRDRGQRFGMDDEQFQTAHLRVVEAMDRLDKADMMIDVQGLPNVHDLELATRARVARLAGKPYLLICDYIQNFGTGQRRQSDTERISEVSRTINGLSKSMQNVAVMPLFQFDKEAEKYWLKEREAPHFSNARGSSQIGNDANHLLIMHRNYRDFEHRHQDYENYTEVIQDLSRHGRIGYRAELHANMALGRFENWDRAIPSDPTKKSF